MLPLLTVFAEELQSKFLFHLTFHATQNSGVKQQLMTRMSRPTTHARNTAYCHHGLEHWTEAPAAQAAALLSAY